MEESKLTPADEDVRGTLTRAIARLGCAPSIDSLASELGRDVEAVTRSLERLGDAHALLLHPGTCRPWVVHPFALSPGSCWVDTNGKGYWANCLYCACGIAAALQCDAQIHTRYGGEAQPVTYQVRNGELQDTGDVFHLSTPVVRWWDNVIFACASFQPFQTVAEARDWCRRHGFPYGVTMSLPALWRFASEWYGSYLSQPWRKRSVEQVQELFRRHELTGPFWDLPQG